MRGCSLGLVELGFRDRIGVRVSDVVRVSTFYFSSHQQPAGPHFAHNLSPGGYSTRPQVKCELQCKKAGSGYSRVSVKFVLEKEVTVESGEGAVLCSLDPQCKNVIEKRIRQQLHARKIANYLLCFRHRLVFYLCLKMQMH